ncbi:hypothetical protein OEG86_10030 [Hoeflea alexandrii]|uniref:hypothetical protein n=1 Tax=Hoeflea alexandrii TaxID=288436 RepID=UPI00227055FB|nr:hypothetical protein [Hoeflea alexandrii]MCY0152512.1 hypothetical protein [Hoeflea alexandrii]
MSIQQSNPPSAADTPLIDRAANEAFAKISTNCEMADAGGKTITLERVRKAVVKAIPRTVRDWKARKASSADGARIYQQSQNAQAAKLAEHAKQKGSEGQSSAFDYVPLPPAETRSLAELRSVLHDGISGFIIPTLANMYLTYGLAERRLRIARAQAGIGKTHATIEILPKAIVADRALVAGSLKRWESWRLRREIFRAGNPDVRFEEAEPDRDMQPMRFLFTAPPHKLLMQTEDGLLKSLKEAGVDASVLRWVSQVHKDPVNRDGVTYHPCRIPEVVIKVKERGDSPLQACMSKQFLSKEQYAWFVANKEADRQKALYMKLVRIAADKTRDHAEKVSELRGANVQLEKAQRDGDVDAIKDAKAEVRRCTGPFERSKNTKDRLDRRVRQTLKNQRIVKRQMAIHGAHSQEFHPSLEDRIKGQKAVPPPVDVFAGKKPPTGTICNCPYAKTCAYGSQLAIGRDGKPGLELGEILINKRDPDILLATHNMTTKPGGHLIEARKRGMNIVDESLLDVSVSGDPTTVDMGQLSLVAPHLAGAIHLYLRACGGELGDNFGNINVPFHRDLLHASYDCQDMHVAGGPPEKISRSRVISEIQDGLKRCNEILKSRPSFIKAPNWSNEIQDASDLASFESGMLQRLARVLVELLRFAGGKQQLSAGLTIARKSGETGVALEFRSLMRLHPSWSARTTTKGEDTITHWFPILMLSATPGEERHLSAATGIADIETIIDLPDIPFKQGTRVVCVSGVGDNRTKIREEISDNFEFPRNAKHEWFRKFMERDLKAHGKTYDPAKAGLVTTLDALPKIRDHYLVEGSENYVTYGGAIGSNKLEDVPVLVIYGRHGPRDDDIIRLSELIFGKRVEEPLTALELSMLPAVDENGNTIGRPEPYVVRDEYVDLNNVDVIAELTALGATRSGRMFFQRFQVKHETRGGIVSPYVREHHDPEIAAISIHFFEDATHQDAIYRARLGNRKDGHECTVYAFTDMYLPQATELHKLDDLKTQDDLTRTGVFCIYWRWLVATRPDQFKDKKSVDAKLDTRWHAVPSAPDGWVRHNICFDGSSEPFEVYVDPSIDDHEAAIRAEVAELYVIFTSRTKRGAKLNVPFE